MRSCLSLALAVVVLGAAWPAAAEESAATSLNPKWHRCAGKHAPDAPGFKRQIALTFDDGPSGKFTRAVISVLRKHKAPATFFVVGRRLRSKKGRAIVRELLADPLFEVGNHTYTHPRMKSLSAKKAADEVDRTARALAALGARPRFFRFPYSESTCATAKLVRSRGYGVAGWHIDSADWCFAAGRGHCSKKRWAKIPDRFRSDMVGLVRHRAQSSDGGILLLHDIHGWSAKRLDELLTGLAKDGFRFVSLSDSGVFPRLNGEVGAP